MNSDLGSAGRGIYQYHRSHQRPGALPIAYPLFGYKFMLNLSRSIFLTAFVLLLGSGCRGVPKLQTPSGEKSPYQQIADVLPELSLGVAEPPGVINMSRSNRIPKPKPINPLDFKVTETAFTIRTNTLVPRLYTVPYEAIEDIDFVYQSFPNILYCFVFPFIQGWRTRLIIDTTFVPDLKKDLISDIQILKSITKDIGLPQPYYYAEELERRLIETKSEWGANRVEVVVTQSRFCPPFIPYAGSNRRVAELFLWAREQVLNNEVKKDE